MQYNERLGLCLGFTQEISKQNWQNVLNINTSTVKILYKTYRKSALSGGCMDDLFPSI